MTEYKVTGLDELTGLTGDEASARLDGYGCGVCLDFGHLEDLGPCPACEPDAADEHLLRLAGVLVVRAWLDEHDHGDVDPMAWRWSA